LNLAERARLSTLDVETYEPDLTGIYWAIIDVLTGARVAQVGTDGVFQVFGGLSGPRAYGDVTEDAAGVGFETDLCGYAWAVVGGDGRVVTGDAGGGVPAGDQVVAALSGYDAGLVGAQRLMVGANLRRIEDPTGDLARRVVTNSAGDLVTAEPDATGALQVWGYHAATATRTQLTATGGVPLSIDGAGRVIYAGADGVRRWVPVTGGTPRPMTARAEICAWGDSITEGYAQDLAAYTPDAAFNNGIGGQETVQIAQRAGAVPVTATVAGGEIPASGGVALTGLTLLDGDEDEALTVSITGTGADPETVIGQLTYATATGIYTFTRTSAGDAVPVPDPAALTILSGLDGTPLETLLACRTVIMCGRNDTGLDDVGEDPADVVDMIEAMVATLTPYAPQVMVLGTINGQVDKTVADGGNLANATLSDERLARVAAINAEMAGRFGGRYVDVMAALEAAGMTEPYTPAATTYQVVKAEWSSDGLHPSAEVGRPWLCAFITDTATQKGWL